MRASSVCSFLSHSGCIWASRLLPCVCGFLVYLVPALQTMIIRLVVRNTPMSQAAAYVQSCPGATTASNFHQCSKQAACLTVVCGKERTACQLEGVQRHVLHFALLWSYSIPVHSCMITSGAGCPIMLLPTDERFTLHLCGTCACHLQPHAPQGAQHTMCTINHARGRRHPAPCQPIRNCHRQLCVRRSPSAIPHSSCTPKAPQSKALNALCTEQIKASAVRQDSKAAEYKRCCSLILLPTYGHT